MRDAKNAKLYTVGDGEDQISLVHVWGGRGACVTEVLLTHVDIPYSNAQAPRTTWAMLMEN